MFVPVTCTQCSKPFQVPEDTLGKTAACPWCQATVLALPVAATGLPAAPAPEPLSLDDAPPHSPLLAPLSPAPAVVRSRRFRLVVPVVFLMLATTAITLVILRYHRGYSTSLEWTNFVAPDGSCSIDLLGHPQEEDADPVRGDTRFISTGWYSGTKTWIGWHALTPAQAQEAAAKDGWVSLRKTLAEPEVERLKSKFGGTVVREATLSQNPETIEVRLDGPNGSLIERIIVEVAEPHPRVYFIGMAGRRVNFDGPEVKRFLESFGVLR